MFSSTSSSSSISSLLSQNETIPGSTTMSTPTTQANTTTSNTCITTATATTATAKIKTKTRDKLLDNEMRSFKNRGFHDGYDKAKGAALQQAFDSGYKKAFEQNFILSTLKGVASALKTSYGINNSSSQLSSHHHQHHRGQSSQRRHRHSYHLTSRPNSAISAASTPSTVSSASSSTATTPQSTIGRRHHHSNNNNNNNNRHHHHRLSADTATLCFSRQPISSSIVGTSGESNISGDHDNNPGNCVSGALDNASTCSSSSSSNSNMDSPNATGFNSSNSFSVNISSNHLSLLDSMKFDGSSDIESIKKDLITICRENRLEILAHYVSQIG